MYARRKIGPITLPAYASPQFQIVFVAMVCFLCPGMFNALNGLGAAGQVNAHDINNANTALYSTFSVIGFFAGSIANWIGLRLTLGIGGFGYFLYVASILSYNHNQNSGFLIFAGALLGFCAALLWTAQGAIMMSYPPENSKGRYISAFWMIFNLGAVLGSLVSTVSSICTGQNTDSIQIPLGINLHSEAGKVSDGTYVAFMILMAIGFILANFLCNPISVERNDGSHVIVMKHPTWKSELIGMFETMISDWYIVALFPMFLASNWFYAYHFQDVNLAKFNVRTRALNGVLYWTSQIIGAFVMGFMLDIKSIRRSTRAKLAVVVLFVLTMAIWGGGYAWQRTYTRAEVSKDGYVKLDWTSSGYIGPMFLFMFYGFYDAAWQTTVYW